MNALRLLFNEKDAPGDGRFTVRLEKHDGGSVVRAGRIEGCLAEWGRRLHDDVFSLPANRAVLAELPMPYGDDE